MYVLAEARQQIQRKIIQLRGHVYHSANEAMKYRCDTCGEIVPIIYDGECEDCAFDEDEREYE
jgi:hypothetical protein